MSKKNKGSNGFNKQGIRDLSYIKGPSKGIVLEPPPDSSNGCVHPDERVIVTSDNLNYMCTKCKTIIGEL